MRIGELSRQVGVSTDSVRFYERSGWLSRATRRDNDYRDYGEPDVAHLRLLIDLRRLDVPLDDAAKIASWCHSRHCADATAHLPHLISDRRADIADRIGARRASGCAGGAPRAATSVARVVDVVGPCCEAADAGVGSAEGACACSPQTAIDAR